MTGPAALYGWWHVGPWSAGYKHGGVIHRETGTRCIVLTLDRWRGRTSLTRQTVCVARDCAPSLIKGSRLFAVRLDRRRSWEEHGWKATKCCGWNHRREPGTQRSDEIVGRDNLLGECWTLHHVLGGRNGAYSSSR